MKQITKKLLAGILVFACVLTLFPENALAKTGIPDCKETGIIAYITVQQTAEESDLLYHNADSKDVVRRKDISFDEKKNTLTLKNFEGYGLKVQNLGSDFKIKLVGENSVGHISILSKYGTGLTITGTGSMKVYGTGSCPIFLNGFDMTSVNFKIESSCSVDVYADIGGRGLGITGSKEKPEVSFEGMDSVKREDKEVFAGIRYFLEEELPESQQILNEDVVKQLQETDKGVWGRLYEKDGEYYFWELVFDNDMESPYYGTTYPVLYKVKQLYMDNEGSRYAIVKKERSFPEVNIDASEYLACYREYTAILTTEYSWGKFRTTSDSSQDTDDAKETDAIASRKDTNWEALNLASYDENGDGALDAKEGKKVEALYGKEGSEIDVSILKNFKNLKTLDVENCNIKGKELDLSQNTRLEKLNCNGCFLEKLDVSKCTRLKTLKCENLENGFAKLDISKCKKLTHLYCTNSQLTELDVSKCKKLKYLKCTGNQITTLNVSNCGNLSQLYCDDNKLASLNVSKNTKLTNLECDDNMLTTLNVTKNKKLTNLQCSYNKLTKLNVSKCTKLKELGCAKNEISKLELSKCKKLKFLYCDASCKVTGYSGEKVCE